MALEFPGWLHVSVAAEQYRVTHWLLRKLVKEGVFTRGRFTSAEADTGPIYLKIEELDAWKTGGVDAVHALRFRKPVEPESPEVVHAADTGESGA